MAKSAGSARSTETILVVEDDEVIRNAIRQILETAGYAVLSASTPMEAIELASNRQVRIHVLLTDVGLLGVTGPQLAKLLVSDRPGLRVLYISGHSEAHAVPVGRVGPGTAFLQKPFTLDALLHEVRQLLDQRAPHGEAGGPSMSDPVNPNLEHQADEARRKLAKAEQGADEALEHAAEQLRELTQAQEQHAERLKKELREPTGPLPPSEPKDQDQE